MSCLHEYPEKMFQQTFK